MNWEFKQRRSENVRAICSNCGFNYRCSVFNIDKHDFTITTIYNYCPNCGQKDENDYSNGSVDVDMEDI